MRCQRHDHSVSGPSPGRLTRRRHCCDCVCVCGGGGCWPGRCMECSCPHSAEVSCPHPSQMFVFCHSHQLHGCLAGSSLDTYLSCQGCGSVYMMYPPPPSCCRTSRPRSTQQHWHPPHATPPHHHPIPPRHTYLVSRPATFG